MMIYPSINKLMKHVDSRFTLVIATAKRAREIADIQNHNPDVFSKANGYAVSKPVAIAIKEISDGKIYFSKVTNQNSATEIEKAYKTTGNITENK